MPPSGKVEILLVYRTLGDWLRSLHSQMLIRYNKDRYDKDNVLSFVEWLRSRIIPNLPSYAHPWQVSHVARRFYNMNITGASIKILKYNGINNTRTQIFCNSLKASHACQQSLSMPIEWANARMDSDLFLLLLESGKRGIMEKNISDFISISRSISVNQIEAYYNPKKKITELSHDCLEAHFLEMIRAHGKEEMILLEKMSAFSEEFIWKDDVLDDHAICTPNIFEVFMEDDWMHILKVLDVVKVKDHSNNLV